MKHVLVTGASGFIGHHVIQALSRHNFAVRKTIRCENRNNTLTSDLTLIPNIDGTTYWKTALQGIDIVVHLASRVHLLRDNVANPLHEYRTVNVDGSLNLARQAAEEGVKRFIYLSSVKVNGEESPEEIPFTESCPLAPKDAYGISKMEAEQGLFNISKKTGLEVVVLRPPLVYGQGVKGNFFNMMKWLSRGIPLPFGAVNNKRSFVAVENLVNFLMLCLHHPAASNQIFFVSDGEDLSTTALLQRLLTKMERPNRLLPLPQQLLKAGLIFFGRRDLALKTCSTLQVDIKKARTHLGWQPIISLDAGLEKTVAWFTRQR